MLRNKYAFNILGGWAAILLWTINLTLRWQKLGLVKDGKHWSEEDPLILAFWHGDQIFMPWSYHTHKTSKQKRPIYALISGHRDGKVAASIISYLSLRAVHGSSTRDGAKALVQLRQKLRAGSHVAITPDGPKGPAHVAKNGIAKLSSLSGAPILPIALASDKAWKFGSWDGMFLPKPFSKVALVAGEKIKLPPNLTKEELASECLRIQNSINKVKEEAESIVGLKNSCLANLNYH